MKTALLDTNVLIQFEDNRFLSEEDALLLRNSSGKISFYIHPIQIRDINKDRNEKRRELLKTRIRRYSELKTDLVLDENYFKKLGWGISKENDLIDNNLLDCLRKNKVNYLITNDKGLHKKAALSNLTDRVFTPSDFLEMFPEEEPVNLCFVKDAYCHEIDTNDAFFDSLRCDYPEFNTWLEKRKPEQRKCWLIEDKNEIQSLCIYKVNLEKNITDEGFNPHCKMLKLCTFKVASYATGTKMGERLLFSAFQFSLLNDIGFIYLTLYREKQQPLIDLLESFGFKEIGTRKDEVVYGKYTKNNLSSEDIDDKYLYDVTFYPSFKDTNEVKKFLLPIRPSYHERLFPDCYKAQMSFFKDELSYYTSESFTIRKSYISKKNSRKMAPGDLVLFYRSRDLRSIQVLGFVDDVKYLDNIEDIIDMVKKRTVYSRSEIEEMLDKSNKLLVINFNVIKYSRSGIGTKFLNDIGLNARRSIAEISDKKYKQIMERWDV